MPRLLPIVRTTLTLLVAATAAACSSTLPGGHRGPGKSDGGHDAAKDGNASQIAGDARMRAHGAAPVLSAVAAENALPGVTFADPEKPADNHEVEGYASAVSAAAGEQVDVFANVDHDQNVRWSLLRLGYYGGLGARLVASGGSVAVRVQPPCPVAAVGLIECDWASAFSVTVDPSWTSGYYVFALVSEEGFETRIPLTVRESGTRAAALVQASVTTWQAYNIWGGLSLYSNRLPAGSVFTGDRARRVSFDRPYAAQNGLSPFLALVRWLEQRGYDVGYTTNVDIDADASALLGRKLFISTSHDEYWSIPERDAVEAARDQGVSLAFLSANSVYWRIRLEPSSRGTARRIVTCYKTKSEPVRNARDTTNLFRHGPNSVPENALIGVMSVDWSGFPGFPLVITNASHWVFEGTGVMDYDTLGNVVGPEWDVVADNGFTPAGLETLSESPAIADNGAPAHPSNSTVYYPTADSFVFASGTIDWGFGLGDNPSYADERIARITDNLFARAGVPGPARKTAITRPTPAVPVLAAAKVLAGSGVAGNLDDMGAAASFSSPTGIAAGIDGELYVTDTGNAVVRKIDKDGHVSTLVKPPDGLSLPTGIAVDSVGDLYVADSGHNRILRITHAGATVEVFAGTGTSGADDATDRLQATFAGPRGLSVGPDGELYVADVRNDAIRRIGASGVSTLATGLGGVTAVAAAADGVVYFSTLTSSQLGVVRNGSMQVLANQAGAPGYRDGPAESARLRSIEGLVAEGARLVFADTGSYRVRALSLGSAPEVTTIFGDGRAPSSSDDALHVMLPRGLAAYAGGYAVVDSPSHRILWFREP